MFTVEKTILRKWRYAIIVMMVSLAQSACMQVVGPELSYEIKGTSEKLVGNKRFRGDVQFQELSPTKVKILQEYYVCDEFQVKKETLVKKTYSCKANNTTENIIMCQPISFAAPFCWIHALYVCGFEAPSKGSSDVQTEEKTECRNKKSSFEVVRSGNLIVTINGEVGQELETDDNGVAMINLQDYPEAKRANRQINLKYDFNGHSFATVVSSSEH